MPCAVVAVGTENMTFSNANAYCRSIGSRLCTRAELQDCSQPKGLGCGALGSKLIWTSTIDSTSTARTIHTGSSVITARLQDRYYESSAGIGARSGGTCTCPSGEVYFVGDNKDGCSSLACVGGVPGKCVSRHA